MEPELNSVDDVSKRLSISVWKVFQLIRQGEIKSVKIGSRRLIPESAITEYIANLQSRSSPNGSDAAVSA